MDSSRRLAHPGMVALAVTLAACATLPPPTEQLAAARAAIESADVGGAASVAPLELTQAREKLSAAQLAVRDNESERAGRLAEEAQADAQLAQAKAATARSREGLAQAEAAMRALRDEANRTPEQKSTPSSGSSTPIPTVTPPSGATTPPTR